MAQNTDMKVIGVLLDEAMDNGLEVEVIYYALKVMQEDPTLSPAQAFQAGMDEWVK